MSHRKKVLLEYEVPRERKRIRLWRDWLWPVVSTVFIFIVLPPVIVVTVLLVAPCLASLIN